MQFQSLGQEDPLEKEWQPTPVFLLGQSHGLKQAIVHRVVSSDTTEDMHHLIRKYCWLSALFQAHCYTPKTEWKTEHARSLPPGTTEFDDLDRS